MVLGRVDSSLQEESLPHFFCPECSALRFEGEPSCATCLGARPEEGWQPLEDADDPYLGCVVDRRYLIEKREAAGGSAVVYRARSLDSDELVALKIARIGEGGSVEESSARERMSREVRAVQMLENSHIVPIYEFLELDDDAAGIVMEYVSGKTAEEVVDEEGPLALDRAVGVVRQVATGLAEAHRSDLIHRDIKPANIMIESGEEGDAYILDFGIVRLQAASGTTQGFIGTPVYASPEQIRMKELDARTDIYSLGATFHFLLTGSPPYEAADSIEVMRAHLESEVPAMAERRGTEIPRALERLVAAMLSKDRGDRPEDLARVVEQLESLSLGGASMPIRDSDGATADSTHAGVQLEVDADETDDGSDREFGARSSGPALDHVSEFHGPSSSSEFTPAASETEEFASLAERTGEVDFDRTSDPNDTRTGVRAPDEREEDRRLAAERSIDFRPEEGDHSRSESSPEGVRLLDTRRGERFLAVGGGETLWLFGSDAPSNGRRLGTVDAGVASGALGDAYAWIGGDDGTVTCLRLEDLERRVAVEATGGAAITGVDVTDDGAALAAGTRTGELLRRSAAHSEWRRDSGEGGIEAVAVGAPAAPTVVAREGGRLETYPSRGSGSTSVPLEEPGEVRSLALAASGDVLAVLFADGRAQVLHAPTGRRVVDIPDHARSNESLFFDEAGNICGVEPRENGWIVRDLASDSVVSEIGVTSAVRRR